MTSSIFLSKTADREFYYMEQDNEFILYFIQDGHRNIITTLFTSLTDLISFYLFTTKQDTVNNKVLNLASVIITSRQRPRSIESAIRKAHIVFGVKEAMKKEEVIFSFVKTDSTKRIARGTNNLELIPTGKQPTKTSTKKVNPLQIRYYDLEKQSYRSFLASNILY